MMDLEHDDLQPRDRPRAIDHPRGAEGALHVVTDHDVAPDDEASGWGELDATIAWGPLDAA